MGWLRNDHQYLGEPLEFRRLRFRDRAEDPRPGIDLIDDRSNDFDPATDAWPTSCTHPGRSSLAGSCRTSAPDSTPAHGVGAVLSAVGGTGIRVLAGRAYNDSIASRSDCEFGDERLPARFWVKAHVDDDSGCWIWTGAQNEKGYGLIKGPARSRKQRAHRFAYERLVGPIPEGLVLDHLCRNPGCVNPDHLEPVTNAENIRRGKRAARTHCLQGHPYDALNTYVTPQGHRECRACKRERGRVYDAKRRAPGEPSTDRKDAA